MKLKVVFMALALAGAAACYSSVAVAAVLEHVEPITIGPGDLLQQPLRRSNSHGQRVSISLGKAPVGARLRVDDEGQLIVSWQTSAQLAPETVIELLVKSIDTQETIERRYMLVRSAETMPASLVPKAAPTTTPGLKTSSAPVQVSDSTITNSATATATESASALATTTAPSIANASATKRNTDSTTYSVNSPATHSEINPAMRSASAYRSVPETSLGTEASQVAAGATITSLTADPFNQQNLRIGTSWHMALVPSVPANDSVKMRVGKLPASAMVEFDRVLGHMLSLTPGAQQTGLHQLKLERHDPARPTIHQPTSVNAKASAPPGADSDLSDSTTMASIATQNTLIGQLGKPATIDIDPATADLPVLTSLANQVVNGGRVVTLRVKASLPDGAEPALQVDRLPRNASFNTNADGSRTFYWQTSDKDQGEHLFRFTAINPNKTRKRSSKEVLIVVGDPSRSKTQPDPLPTYTE